MGHPRTPPPSRPNEAEIPPFDRRRLVLRLRTSIPSTGDAINQTVKNVLRMARRTGCLKQGLADVEISLREALANAVIHGNRSRPDKRVSLRCYGDPAWGILIVIRDEGKGFDPNELPDPRSAERLQLPHGRGVFLMHKLMDRAAHRKGGREVILYKQAGKKPPSSSRPARRSRKSERN